MAPSPGRALLAALALAAFGGTPAFALDLPKRKSGLWEMTMSREGGPPGSPTGPQVMQMCIDEKTDDISRQMGENASREMCTRREVRNEGGRVIADSVCKLGDITATSHAVMSGHFDASYQVEATTKFDPPMMGVAQARSLVKARWIGPCPRGQRPGDVTLPGGMRINIFDAEKAAPSK